METQARHRRVKAIFYDAWLRPLSERTDFLAAACAGDHDLLFEVQTLLDYQGLRFAEPRSFPSRAAVSASRKFRRGAIVAGRYRIERLVGQGGMGEVYAVEDRMLGESMALKVLRRVDDVRRRQLIDEVRLTRQITHPGVCRMYDIGDHEGTPFLTMELIEGEDLARRLARSGPLPAAEVAALGVRLCEALAAAHDAGVLHRDLKPSNVLVDRSGGVHITDFGLARSRETGALDAPRVAGMIFGTPAYMAPEESAAAGAVTEKTDLYSLGLVLYELVTGAPPFDASDLGVLMELHRSAVPEPPSRRVSDIDPYVERAILDLLAKDPEERPDSARTVAEALKGRGLQPAAPAAGVEEGERRTVALMLCRLAGLAGRDVEVTPGMLRLFQARCAALVRLHGGRVVRHVERSLLVQFGYPESGGHEVDSAARAGLAILGEARAGTLERELDGRAEPALAIDVRSGTFHGGSRHPRITAPASLRRLEELVVPGSLVVSDAVLAGLRGAYEIEPIEHTVSGAGAHRILALRSRASARPDPPRLTPLIGRSEELALLGRCWRRAGTGRGQVVLLTGEAGLGKSRLTAEFARQVGEETVRLEAICSPLHHSSALHPILELLGNAFELHDSDDGAARVGKLERALTQLSSGARVLPAFSRWLERPADKARPATGTGLPLANERRLFIRALGEWILGMAEGRPLALICEDLQWADPTTLEALDHLAGQVQTSSVMMLLTSRPEFRPPREGVRLTPLALQPLDETEARALIEAAGAALDLPDGVAESIVARAEGNPLFLEELVKERADAPAASEPPNRGAASTPPLALQSLLAARLDRLGPAKRVAQAAAVCGRTLSYRLLESVTAADGLLTSDDLPANVDRLLDAEILFQRGTLPEATLTFKHALLAEATHLSLPPRRKQSLHAAVARILPEIEPGSAASRPEVVAAHWAEAGNHREAIEWWRRAGVIALDRSAFAEAATHFERAIGLLGAVAEVGASTSLEVELWMSLSLAETGREGPSSPSVAKCMRRVRALCPRLEDDRELARSLFHLSRYHLVHSNRRRTLDFMERLEAACDRIDDPYLEACVQAEMSSILTMSSRLAEAEVAHQRALDRYAATSATPSWIVTVDPLVLAETVKALRASLLGQSTLSRRGLQAAVEAADRLGHPFSRCYPRIYGAVVGLLNEDFAATATLVGEGIAIASSVEASGLVGLGRGFEACAAIGPGVATAGVARMEAGLAAFDATGHRALRPVVLLFLAQALERDGANEAALGVLDEALDHTRRCVDSYLLPEVQRRRGEVLARLGRAREAEAALRAGLSAARRKEALGLESRAASSLARFLETRRPS